MESNPSTCIEIHAFQPAKLNEEPLACTICYDSLGSQSTRIVCVCNRAHFCQECLEAFQASNHSKCPLCQSPIQRYVGLVDGIEQATRTSVSIGHRSPGSPGSIVPILVFETDNDGALVAPSNRVNPLTDEQVRAMQIAIDQDLVMVPPRLIALSTACNWPQLVTLVVLGILASTFKDRIVWNVSVLAAGSVLEMVKSRVLFNILSAREPLQESVAIDIMFFLFTYGWMLDTILFGLALLNGFLVDWYSSAIMYLVGRIFFMVSASLYLKCSFSQ